jgi:hypothetical protein
MADERDRLRKLRQLEATTPKPSPTPVTSLANDPYYIRDPKTGLSPAQMEARAGLEAAQTALKDVGVESKLLTSGTQAGRLAPKPADVPSDANYNYTWKFMPQPGNLLGGNWELVRTPRFGTSGGGGAGGGGGGGGGGGDGGGGGKRVVSTYTDEETGDVIAVYSDGTTAVISKGNRIATASLQAQQAAAAEAERKRQEGQSAYTLLLEQFRQYGLGSLVEPLKDLIVEGLSPAEFTLRLRDTEAYKKRFAANSTRINKGLRALSEAEYIGLEDQYQNIMRRYGLPENYYSRGDMGRQEGFERFIGGDVSPVELEDRIQLAQNRVINAAPEVAASLRSFYPDITNGDILAYALDPDKALEGIRRKVTAAEIGGAAAMAGLATGVGRAEELGRFGVTGESARQGFQTIAEILPRGSQLAEIYKESPYTQATAEQEVFGITGAAESAKKRRRLQQLETATFSGSSGAAGGALGRERAGAF